jgi:signal transduction histidine kinase
VVALADGIAGLGRNTDTRAGTVLPRTLLTTVRRALRLEDVAVVEFGPNGRTDVDLPAGLTVDQLALERLRAGEAVSGTQGLLVYAAAPVQATVTRSGVARNTTVAVVAAQRVETDVRTFRFFLAAALAVCVLSAAVAVTLGRRLTRPVRDADAAARRIAAGELSTRLPEPAPGATDELADLVRSVNSMAEALERSKGLEQSFLLSVSHDLRTPLTSIRGYAEAINDGATKDPAWAAGVILAESRRLERLVRDLLDLAKLQARSFSLHPARHDLSQLAVEAVEGVAPDAAAAGVRVVAACPAPVPAVIDPDRMAQVLANLVENAMKYANGTVQVGSQAAAGTAMVWVDDDGPGIAPEDRPFVFERLYVSRRQPKRAEVGSGLGLAIVAELVAAMGGTVTAESAPGGGARMVVRLPLAA